MEHLKAAFHDELADPHIENVRVSDGLVHIREWNWPPHEVLISMGKAAYDQAFKNWREERREALLAKAEEVLISYDQADRFALLKESYRRGLVMPFVGAGMSMPSGYISWTTFLNRLWTDAGLDEARLNTMLDAGQYEQAAQVAADTLGFGFNERVAARYSLDKELKGAVQYLPYVFPK